MKNKQEMDPGKIAIAHAKNLAISTKHSVEISNALRYKPTSYAKKFLEEVASLKRAVPFKKFKRDVGHKAGMAAGRFPQKAAKEFLKLVKSVEANAQVKGLDTSNLKIIKILANKASIPMTGGRQRSGTKRSHLEIAVKEIGGKKKTKPEAKVEEKKEEVKPEAKVEEKKEVKEEKEEDLKEEIKEQEEQIKGEEIEGETPKKQIKAEKEFIEEEKEEVKEIVEEEKKEEQPAEEPKAEKKPVEAPKEEPKEEEPSKPASPPPAPEKVKPEEPKVEEKKAVEPAPEPAPKPEPVPGSTPAPEPVPEPEPMPQPLPPKKPIEEPSAADLLKQVQAKAAALNKKERVAEDTSEVEGLYEQLKKKGTLRGKEQ